MVVFGKFSTQVSQHPVFSRYFFPQHARSCGQRVFYQIKKNTCGSIFFFGFVKPLSIFKACRKQGFIRNQIDEQIVIDFYPLVLTFLPFAKEFLRHPDLPLPW